jgi:DNA integrity scanning protein DisA with diadenylate cyclase activity
MPLVARLRRLAEELAELGLELDDADSVQLLLLEEIDAAMRPATHERRVPSGGVITQPTTDPATWGAGTQLDISPMPVANRARSSARRYADGLSCWLVCRVDGEDEWLMFDRPAGSERDLVVLAQTLGATMVQRHPSGAVRVVGGFGVLRWERLSWHLEPPTSTWIDTVSTGDADERVTLLALIEFAVHDLGAPGIGALLVHQPHDGPEPTFEQRIPTPPPLDIHNAFHLAPLRHVLSQVDGAAVFDGLGVLRHIGVRIVPSVEAEHAVAWLGGTRHTAALRHSYDDPSATVIAVSEDGPVTVMRAGAVVGRSPFEG